MFDLFLGTIGLVLIWCQLDGHISNALFNWCIRSIGLRYQAPSQHCSETDKIEIYLKCSTDPNRCVILRRYVGRQCVSVPGKRSSDTSYKWGDMLFIVRK
jgi:hypothetical protein